MIVRPLAAVLGVVAVLLVLAPGASAEPRPVCGPAGLEDEVVRVFPRVDGSSALTCGSRYFGFRRIDWSVVSEDAIARTLLAPRTITEDARSETRGFAGAPGGVDVVVTSRHGEIVTAQPAVG